MTQSYADVHVTGVNSSFIYFFIITLNNRWVHGYLFSLRIPDACKLPGFGYNHLYISLITVQKDRRFTAATIIIHHSRNRQIKPTYDHESPPYTSTGEIVSCVGTKHNSRFFLFRFLQPTRNHHLIDGSTPLPWPKRCKRAPAKHLSCDHECVCTLPLNHTTNFSIVFVIHMAWFRHNRGVIADPYKCMAQTTRWKMNRPVSSQLTAWSRNIGTFRHTWDIRQPLRYSAHTC